VVRFHMGLSMFVLRVQRNKTHGFFMFRESEKHLKKTLVPYGPFNVCLTSPKKENSWVFYVYRV
jgi:hypothetical protein